MVAAVYQGGKISDPGAVCPFDAFFGKLPCSKWCRKGFLCAVFEVETEQVEQREDFGVVNWVCGF